MILILNSGQDFPAGKRNKFHIPVQLLLIMWAVLSSNIAFAGTSKEIKSVNKIA